MINSDLNTEQLILDAAEAEFLEKGYANAKTMGIARRAGVSHPLLHYYFRKKEKLFEMIFQKKVQALSESFEGIESRGLPFSEMLRPFIECQFDFVAENPRLPHFVLHEIVSKKSNLELVANIVMPKISRIYNMLEKSLNAEIAAGRVRPVKTRDLLMNIVTMNISTFVFMPVMLQLFPAIDND
ncbi:MAG: TetR/AcrR family transcriptional regulator, partial [Tannerella sp.]|nr:TetR/AcrR family transcriptional regulator [Tannerella sp.]